MLPYCIDLIDVTKQLPESLSCDVCSAPPPASSSTTVFGTLVYVCVGVFERERAHECVLHSLKHNRHLCYNQEIGENWRSGKSSVQRLCLLLCS